MSEASTLWGVGWKNLYCCTCLYQRVSVCVIAIRTFIRKRKMMAPVSNWMAKGFTMIQFFEDGGCAHHNYSYQYLCSLLRHSPEGRENKKKEREQRKQEKKKIQRQKSRNLIFCRGKITANSILFNKISQLNFLDVFSLWW